MSRLQLQFQYASIPKRCYAYVIDFLIAYPIFGFVLNEWQTSDPVATNRSIVAFWLVSVLLLAYFALMESSKARGTLGKMIMGIETIDRDGKQISFKHASWRSLGKNFSLLMFIFVLVITKTALGRNHTNAACDFWHLGENMAFILGYLGYLMAAFTPHKQALHDRLAGTYVVETGEPRPAPKKALFLIVAIAISFIIMLNSVPTSPRTLLRDKCRNTSSNTANSTAPVEPLGASTEPGQTPPQESSTPP